MPKISVIIPAYNAQATISETVSSVLNQTFKDLEIIVINDGSTDQTLNLVESFNDPRVKCFSYENRGLATSRNRGISRAIGEYISFLDADDLWTSDKLYKQLNILENSSTLGVVYSWTYNMFGSKENLEKVKPVFFEGNVYDNLLVSNFLGHGSNLLMRRSIIDEIGLFNANLKAAEDWDFYLRIASKYDFGLVPEHQILYRKSRVSMSGHTETIYNKKMLDSIDIIYKSVPRKYQNKKQESIANIYMYFSEKSLESPREFRDIKLALKYLIISINCSSSMIFSGRFIAQVKRVLKCIIGLTLFSLRAKGMSLGDRGIN